MAVENVKLLLEKVAGDESLQEQLKNLHSEMNEEVIKEIIKIGEKQGLRFTEEDFYTYITEAVRQAQNEGELSDEELENVAGGSKWVGYSMVTFGVLCGIAAVTSAIYKAKFGNSYVCVIERE